jgi:hypothetical protein
VTICALTFGLSTTLRILTFKAQDGHSPLRAIGLGNVVFVARNLPNGRKEQIILKHIFCKEITPQKSLFSFSMWKTTISEAWLNMVR